jgi:hypothetical protein
VKEIPAAASLLEKISEAEASDNDDQLLAGPVQKMNDAMAVVQDDVNEVLNEAAVRREKKAGQRRESMTAALKALAKDLKVMQQACERLVVSQEEFPTLVPFKKEQVEVSGGATLYYRLELAGLRSPLKFLVRVDGPGSFEVTMSTKTEQPTHQSCEERYSDQSVFYLAAQKIGKTREVFLLRQQENAKLSAGLAPPETETFVDAYLYVGISSFTSCSLELEVVNVETRAAILKKKIAGKLAA